MLSVVVDHTCVLLRALGSSQSLILINLLLKGHIGHERVDQQTREYLIFICLRVARSHKIMPSTVPCNPFLGPQVLFCVMAINVLKSCFGYLFVLSIFLFVCFSFLFFLNGWHVEAMGIIRSGTYCLWSFTWSPCVCVSSLQVLWFPPTSHKHSVTWTFW